MHADFVTQFNASLLVLILVEIDSTTLFYPKLSMVKSTATPFFRVDGPSKHSVVKMKLKEYEQVDCGV